MTKKNIIFISIVIFIISLIGIIVYYNKNKSMMIEAEILVVGKDYLLVGTTNNEDYVVKTKDINYQVGDKIKLELTNINKNKTPFEAVSKSITKLEKSNPPINEEDNKEEIIGNEKDNNDKDNNEEIIESDKDNNKVDDKNSNVETLEKDNFNDEQVINYFESLNNDLANYNKDDESLGKKIKEKFVMCIDFLFYDKEIGGKTFSELTSAAKLKILEIAMAIDSKIESKFPGYKESISSTYQNIKSKIVSKYLEITTNICNENQDICETAKEGFKDLKESFGITWDFIKELAKNGISKLKDWYEIWRYN